MVTALGPQASAVMASTETMENIGPTVSTGIMARAVLPGHAGHMETMAVKEAADLTDSPEDMTAAVPVTIRIVGISVSAAISAVTVSAGILENIGISENAAILGSAGTVNAVL